MAIIKKIFNSFSGKEKTVFFTALILAFISSFVLSGFAMFKITKAIPSGGGEYTEGIVGQPTFINPVLATSETDRSLVKLLFNNLEDLSDKIEIDPNGRSWKVRLKENLHWSDGEKLTSDDIVFTVQKIQDPDTQSPLFSSWQGVTANRLSELEIQFNLVIPYAFFRSNFKNLYILPKHLFADVPSANWRLSIYNLKPVGSGPYKFKSYSQQADGFISSYYLQANHYYPAGRPLIYDFYLKFFPNTADLIKSFNSGAIGGFLAIGPKTLKEIERSYQIVSFSLPSYYAVFFNQSQNLALKEASVRQALDLAVDRQLLVKEIFDDKAIGFDKPPLPYDFANPALLPAVQIELANKILDDVGWQKNILGFREKQIKDTKINLEFNLTVPQNDFLTKTADYLKKSWQEIGVKVNVSVFSPEEISDVIIKNRDYQAILFGNILNSNFDLFSFWHSSQRFYPGLNLALYKNTQADQLIENIKQTLKEDVREKQFQDLVNTIKNDEPAVFLYSPSYLFITKKELKGVNSSLIFEPADRFSDIRNWYLKTTRVLR